MRCLYLSTFLIVLLAACQNMGSAPKQQGIVASTAEVETEEETDSIKQLDTVTPISPTYLREVKFIEGKTMLSGAYRIWEEADDLANIMKGEWLQLHLEGNKLAINPLLLTFEEGFDACAAVKTKALSSTHDILMAVQLNKIKEGIYKVTPLTNDRVWPKETVDFTFNGRNYQLQGFGDIAETEIRVDEDEREEVFHFVSNYELRLQDEKGNIVTLVSEESFNDTFIHIKFIGDLDGDEKPDFIIAAPRHYEEERILLILSSDTQADSLRIYEALRQFDC